MSIKVTPNPIKVTPSALSKLPRLIQKWSYSFICWLLLIHNYLCDCLLLYPIAMRHFFNPLNLYKFGRQR